MIDLQRFQSTLPARGATCNLNKRARRVQISIHAPRTGSDRSYSGACALRTNFNPRSPHGERHAQHRGGRQARDFNPRSPHGERLRSPPSPSRCRSISIHAPRTGSDTAQSAFWSLSMIFQSTLPARGATIPYIDKLVNSKISIHAPRTGSDSWTCAGCLKKVISIHAPRTGSDAWCAENAPSCVEFQSTLPARGATLRGNALKGGNAFQSTLPARGAT